MIKTTKTVSALRKAYLELEKEGMGKKAICDELAKRKFEKKWIKKYSKEYCDLDLLTPNLKKLNYLLSALIWFISFLQLLSLLVNQGKMQLVPWVGFLIGVYVLKKRRSGYFSAIAFFGMYLVFYFIPLVLAFLMKGDSWMFFTFGFGFFLHFVIIVLSIYLYKKLFNKIQF